MKEKVLFIFVVLLIVGCKSKPEWFYKRLPEQLLYIENDIKANLAKGTNLTNYGYFIRPIATKKNDIGIYLYAIAKPHLVWHHVFMYDGDTVIFTNLKDSIGMCQFLQENNFSELEIKKWKKTVKFLNEDAQVLKEFKL